MIGYKIVILNQEDQTVRFKFSYNDVFLSFEEVTKLWMTNAEFVMYYCDSIKAFGFKAFFWEHPALKKDYLNKDYECILVNSNILKHKYIDENAFKDHIYSEKNVADFLNLGKSARLIVPTKKSEDEIYNHFAKFITYADVEQVYSLFQTLGQALLEELEKHSTIWLSTAGLGVIWLHVRLDLKPKYYRTEDYKNDEFLIN